MEFNPYVIHIHSERHLREEFLRIGSTEAGNRIMGKKGLMITLRIDNIGLKAANILKQEMLAVGGDAAVHRDVAALAIDHSSMVLTATAKQYEILLPKLKLQPFGLKRLASELEEVLGRHAQKWQPRALQCGSHQLPLGQRTLIMGIVNVTPDSFSDGGRYYDVEAAVRHAHQLVEEGADLLDVGGESTRPGHTAVEAEEELRRVIPVIERLVKELHVPISIDTYKARVAKAAVEAGAHIVNDVWGFKRDRDMAQTCADLGVPVILMHNRREPLESDVMNGIIREIRESIDLALEAGVKDENIILDPGIGFGKSYEDNLLVLRHLADFCGLGYPVLLGTSRKSVIGNTLNLPVNERVEGTAATVALGIAQGVDIVRVHDVLQMKRVALMADALVR
ncbi:dihydropteroate synthase [Effusibacillus lacus]|uniref:Dihydropteroate synthase n=1 Tax=Effusibacillus lacus TaxID=1348429 RepID=A0A292YJG6_9BACL|nr:dihydropteroate synthase [Effusibacillus lacus]TCS74495.1 dihydropteroate synthase [Effusibacillus lacus]GAX88635.1 dihydropteroate synthase [Effusibacillus lacus]